VFFQIEVHSKNNFRFINIRLWENFMKKIAIITELSLNSVNYGNYIQAFALNYYLKNCYRDYHVETILLKKGTGRKITSWMFYFKRIQKKIEILLQNKHDPATYKRFERFNEFAKKYIILSKKVYTYDELTKSEFDYYVVGSDIVWFQSRGFFNKTKFLAFTPKKCNARKIAYAASFGENFLPKENVRLIKEFLNDFNMISVRESSGIDLLNNIGIKNIKHVCDPTLLLSVEEWDFVASDVSKINKYKNKEYAFIYILGNNKREKRIKEICNQNGIEPVFVACNNTYSNEILQKNGFDNCSPQEWVWLIKNAKYIFTDSFHGLIFSTIYKKPFLIVKRENTRDLNIRMLDYLEKIDELEKLVDIDMISDLKSFTWNYEIIEKKMDNFIEMSKRYINDALRL